MRSRRPDRLRIRQDLRISQARDAAGDGAAASRAEEEEGCRGLPCSAPEDVPQPGSEPGRVTGHARL